MRRRGKGGVGKGRGREGRRGKERGREGIRGERREGEGGKVQFPHLFNPTFNTG